MNPTECPLCGAETRIKVWVTTDDDVDAAIQDACYFVIEARDETYLCTLSEYGDVWALRFATEDDPDDKPKVCLIESIPLPWEIEVLS